MIFIYIIIIYYEIYNNTMSDTFTGVVRTYYDTEKTKLKEEYFMVNNKKEGIYIKYTIVQQDL